MYNLKTDRQHIPSNLQFVFNSANIPGILPNNTQKQLNKEYKSQNLVCDLRQSTAINRIENWCPPFEVLEMVLNAVSCVRKGEKQIIHCDSMRKRKNQWPYLLKFVDVDLVVNVDVS